MNALLPAYLPSFAICLIQTAPPIVGPRRVERINEIVPEPFVALCGPFLTCTDTTCNIVLSSKALFTVSEEPHYHSKLPTMTNTFGKLPEGHETSVLDLGSRIGSRWLPRGWPVPCELGCFAPEHWSNYLPD